MNRRGVKPRAHENNDPSPNPITPNKPALRGGAKIGFKSLQQTSRQGSELRANISHANPFVKLAYGRRSRSLCGDLRRCRQCASCWRKAARIPAGMSLATRCLICHKSCGQNGLSHRQLAAVSPEAPPPIMPSLRPAVSACLVEFPKVLAAAAPIPRESENLGRVF